MAMKGALPGEAYKAYVSVIAEHRVDGLMLPRIIVWETGLKYEVDRVVDVIYEKTGVKIVLKALEEPVRQIAANAGFEGAVVIDKILSRNKFGFGFDAYNEKYVDMFEAGIIDPTKVSRCALQNAASVASTVLTTEALVVDIKEPEPAAPAGGAGGMGGMY